MHSNGTLLLDAPLDAPLDMPLDVPLDARCGYTITSSLNELHLIEYQGVKEFHMLACIGSL